MAHPFKGQADASQRARLKRLGATAGKSFGSSAMYSKKSYPSERAGTQREFTISGGSAKSRPDRLASGGGVKKRRPHATTNIIISHAGGRGGEGGGGGAGGRPGMGPPMPIPVNRPVPVPAGAGPGGPGPVPPVVGGPTPLRPPMPPMGAGPPPGAPPIRPPGMKKGGVVGKRANGGFLKESKGKAYAGYPNSPTSEAGDKVSAHKKGGGVKKLQFGGGSGLGSGTPAASAQGAGLLGLLGSSAPGRAPMPAQKGVPTISGVDQIPAQPLTVPQPKLASAFMQRPAPGTTTTFRKGGAVHDDEAQDKKLIKKMLKQEDKAEKRAAGGIVKTPVTNASGSGAGGKARLKKTRAAKGVPAKTEKGSPSPGNNPAPRGMSGSVYHQQGKGMS